MNIELSQDNNLKNRVIDFNNSHNSIKTPSVTGKKLIFTLFRKASSSGSDGLSVSDVITELGLDLSESRAKLSQFLLEQTGVETFSSLRLKAGLSQSQLADKIGVKQEQISRWTNNETDIGMFSLEKISVALGVSIDVLIAGFGQEWNVKNND